MLQEMRTKDVGMLSGAKNLTNSITADASMEKPTKLWNGKLRRLVLCRWYSRRRWTVKAVVTSTRKNIKKKYCLTQAILRKAGSAVCTSLCYALSTDTNDDISAFDTIENSLGKARWKSLSQKKLVLPETLIFVCF